MNDKSRPKAAPAITGEEIEPNDTARRQRRLALDLDNFQRRIVQDALAEGMASNWRRRAAVLEAARPRPGDFTGHATAGEVAARDARLRTDADRCRRHAELLLQAHADAYAAEVRQVLAEVA